MTFYEEIIILFHQKKVRRHWDEVQELWYFSVVDVIEILTDSKRPRKYWSDLKKRLINEGSEVSEKIGQIRDIRKHKRRWRYRGNLLRRGSLAN